MNKTIKGVLAAGTASVLLVGGAGTLAYWNDSATVGGATFTAGDLKLDASSCASAGWTVTNSVARPPRSPSPPAPTRSSRATSSRRPAPSASWRSART